MGKDAKWLCASGSAALAAAAALAFPRIAPVWPVAAAVACAVCAAAALSRRFAHACAALFLVVFAVAARRVDSASAAIDSAAVANPSAPSVFEFVVPAGASWRPRGEGGLFSFRASRGALALSVCCVVEPGGRVPAAGEKWRFAGWLERSRAMAPWERRRFWVGGRGASMELLDRAGPLSLQAWIARAKASLGRRAVRGLENMPEAAPLVRAMLLGERGGMERDAREAFAAAGTIHVFAISGLHVMVLAKLLQAFFTITGAPLRLAAAAAVPALWGYAALAGAPPSAVRAAAMATFYFASWTCWRRPDALASWSQTFILFAVLAPESLAGTGCVLSFAVMLSLALWGRYGVCDDSLLPVRAGAPLVAWLAGAPVVACAFGRFSPGGLLANIAAVPAVCAAFTASALGTAASFVSAPLSSAANVFAGLVLTSLSGLSRIVAAVPGMSFEVSPWTGASCAAWYAALAAGFAALAWRRRCKLPLSNKAWEL